MKLAVDIGGTFTDVVLERPSGHASTKVLTTHDAPARGVIDGILQLLEQTGSKAADVELVIHGTTLATNALIERKGARTALITTEGFRDSLEIAYEHRFEQYDLYMERPDPLIPRDRRLTIPERVAADGSVLIELDEDAVRALVPILKEAEIESAAVCLLHSYINPDHEKRVREILQSELPGLSLTLSCEVCPEIREYERVSTTCANAYVQPLMAGYLRELEGSLADNGLDCPFLLMMSSGGITTVETAIAQPIRLIESGPAGGVIFSQAIAAECGIKHALSFDMGGTTAKLTLIDDLMPQYDRSFEVARQYRFLKGSGLPIRIPVIDMVEIGAGGGSVARVDELKRITVGPDSAGSMPGPACYGRGGTAPTVTDADVVLGRIDPANFAGGKIMLDQKQAENAITPAIGSQLDMETVIAAAGISEIVDETMASAARIHAVEKGKDTGERTLIAMGGAAPLHCARLAEKLDIDRVIVPKRAGVGSAYGFLRAPISYEVIRTRMTRLDGIDPHALSEMFAEMRAEAHSVVCLGAPDARLVETREAFMRYRGQGHEIVVSLPVKDYDDDIRDELRTWFEEEYVRLFGRVVPGLEVEALTWALTLASEQAPIEEVASPTNGVAPKEQGRRRLFDPGNGQEVEASLYDRSEMAVGSRVDGPAVIVEAETATVVPAGFDALVSTPGHLILTRQSHAA
ncbi:MAG: hydantoinase/oxoprolinase family protein [Hyphomicrobiaceae bacterium]|nr:hydantoinase/oxoprolinase family protein [Hyphomicrobiaceae bacterium]